MTAYMIAQIRDIDLNDEVAEYLRRVDDTLTPFEGRFLVHGSTPEVLDGDLPGTIVLIAFPDLARAHAWYASPEYQAILPLRVNNSEGGAAALAGVPEGYRAASFLETIGH